MGPSSGEAELTIADVPRAPSDRPGGRPSDRSERYGRVLMLGLGLGPLAGLASFGSGDAQGAWRAAFVAALLPLVPLTIGLRLGDKDRRATLVLMLGVPVALALGGVARPGVQPTAIVFWVLAATLVAFLLESARLFAPDDAPDSLVAINARRPVPTPRRVRRRVRVYAALQIAAALAFALPLGVALAGSGPPLFAVATAGLLGAVASRAFLIDPLERHLQRDPALAVALARLKRHARKGRPAAVFYVAASAALVGMLMFIARRYLATLGAGAP